MSMVNMVSLYPPPPAHPYLLKKSGLEHLDTPLGAKDGPAANHRKSTELLTHFLAIAVANPATVEHAVADALERQADRQTPIIPSK